LAGFLVADEGGELLVVSNEDEDLGGMREEEGG
jgi:hypothetical protein